MAAPIQPQAAAQQMQQQSPDTPAQAVGNQFVSQYYTVQHASPKHLHRFYSDASTLTFGDVRPDGFFSKNATGQKTIHELVMELGYEDTSTEIYTVDSQYSLNGGVVVQVTGIMQRPGGAKRPFVQTFFLAVQEKGYYVLNDIFRYLPLVPPPSADNGGAAAASAAAPALAQAAATPASVAAAPPPPATAVVPPAVPAVGPPAVQQTQLAMQQLGLQQAAAGEQPNGIGAAGVPIAQPPPPPPPVAVQYTGYGVLPVPAVPPVVAVPLPMRPGAVVPPPVVAAPLAVAPPRGPLPPPAAAAGVPPPPRPQQVPKPAPPPGEPLSYAERLRQGKASAPGSPSKQQRPQQPLAGDVAAAPPTPAPTAAAAGDEGSALQAQQQQQQSGQAAAESIQYEEPPNPSVFLRGIPAAVTMVQLVERLSQYGPLRPQGVILKTQKGRDSFAFVDFEDAAPAQRLLQEGLEIDGVRLEVQPKRPLIFRPAMHGGRGGGPNGEMGGRGPGRYDGGGRGFRPGRGGRGPYPGPPPVSDGRLGPMGGPPRGGMMGPPGPGMPAAVPMGPVPGRGYGPDGPAYVGGRGYGGGRGRGRGMPPPPQAQQQQAAQQQPQQPQQQPQQQAAAPLPAPPPQAQE